MRRPVAAALLLVLAATPAAAQVTEDDVTAARERLREVRQSLEAETARYESAQVTLGELGDRLGSLQATLTARERELVIARRTARERAAEMYMASGAASTTGDSAEQAAWAPARLVYLESVSLTDREVINRLEITRRDYEQQRKLVESAAAEHSALATDIDALLAGIYGQLEEADADYRAVKSTWDAQEAERIRREQEEAARRATTTTTTVTTIPASTSTTSGGGTTTTTTQPAGSTTTTTSPPPPPPAGTRVCPVDGATTFSDTWGDPRPGGRAHSGTDLLAAAGTPLVAIESGHIWSPNWHAAGGLGLYIDGDSGDRWYYAHLSDYAPGIVGGLRVEAGQLVGYVGQTGNASTPHLHLGWQPGKGSLQNPYPIVAGLC